MREVVDEETECDNVVVVKEVTAHRRGRRQVFRQADGEGANGYPQAPGSPGMSGEAGGRRRQAGSRRREEKGKGALGGKSQVLLPLRKQHADRHRLLVQARPLRLGRSGAQTVRRPDDLKIDRSINGNQIATFFFRRSTGRPTIRQRTTN